MEAQVSVSKKKKDSLGRHPVPPTSAASSSSAREANATAYTGRVCRKSKT